MDVANRYGTPICDDAALTATEARLLTGGTDEPPPLLSSELDPDPEVDPDELTAGVLTDPDAEPEEPELAGAEAAEPPEPLELAWAWALACALA